MGSSYQCTQQQLSLQTMPKRIGAATSVILDRNDLALCNLQVDFQDTIQASH